MSTKNELCAVWVIVNLLTIVQEKYDFTNALLLKETGLYFITTYIKIYLYKEEWRL